jgi:cytochrome c553
MLVTTGAATAADGKAIPGRTMQCTICHGADLNGLGNLPGIAGRSPSYLVRQMYDMQQGTRVSPLMKSVVANLTEDDMIAIGAYVASRNVP